MTSDLHPTAATGFGSAAEEYERSRPNYPDEAIDRLVQELEITRRGRVLDLGAGTGKLTRMLAPTGASVIAVEPVEAMWRMCAEVIPEVPVVGAVAEHLPFPDGSFDGVVCGQAFHWFRGVEALEEIHRILKPRGRLGLVWNLRDISVDWVRRLQEIIRSYEDAAPHEQTGEWRAGFAITGLFGTLHQRRFPHSQTLDAQKLLDRVGSMSFVAALAPEERKRVLEDVKDLIATHPDLRGDGTFELPYVTDLYWCSRA